MLENCVDDGQHLGPMGIEEEVVTVHHVVTDAPGGELAPSPRVFFNNEVIASAMQRRAVADQARAGLIDVVFAECEVGAQAGLNEVH